MLVVNHWLDGIELDYLTTAIGDKRPGRGGGFRQGVRPALTAESSQPSKKRKALK